MKNHIQQFYVLNLSWTCGAATSNCRPPTFLGGSFRCFPRWAVLLTGDSRAGCAATHVLISKSMPNWTQSGAQVNTAASSRNQTAFPQTHSAVSLVT